MTAPESTLVAAIVAASVASLGLLWSIGSFFISRHLTKTTAARSEWRSQFEQAHALALSTDPNQARTGALWMKSLSTAKWVTDADRTLTATVLLALPPGVSAPTEVNEVLSSIRNKSVASALARVSPGPKGRFELWTDANGRWRWRAKAGNGEVIAVSPEGYSSQQAAMEAMRVFRPDLP